jgi:hypothetical protein
MHGISGKLGKLFSAGTMFANLTRTGNPVAGLFDAIMTSVTCNGLAALFFGTMMCEFPAQSARIGLRCVA